MIVITFHTTAEAFAFEASAKSHGLPGQLGTIPRTLSAGCGFAWLGEDVDDGCLRGFVEQGTVEYEGVYQI